jgi:hypothetical protein
VVRQGVKNSNKPNKLTLKKEKYEGSLDIKNPIITILFDLGTGNSAIIPVDSFSPHVFAFRISGFDRKLYKCIRTRNMDQSLKMILNHQTTEFTASTAQDFISSYNRRSGRLGFAEGFPALLTSPMISSPLSTAPKNVKKHKARLKVLDG